MVISTFDKSLGNVDEVAAGLAVASVLVGVGLELSELSLSGLVVLSVTSVCLELDALLVLFFSIKSSFVDFAKSGLFTASANVLR